MRIGGGRAFTAGSDARRFGFGVCGSIRETASVTGLAAGAGAAAAIGAGFAGAGLRPVIGAKAERVAGLGVTSGFAADTGLASANAVGADGAAGVTGFSCSAIISWVVEAATGTCSSALLLADFAFFAGLAAAARARVEDDLLADVALFVAVLRAAGVFRAADFVVVVFVGIENISAHGREQFSAQPF